MEMLLSVLICVLLVGAVGASNSQVYEFQLGNFKCMSVSDGSGYVGLQVYYPQIPQETLQQNREYYNYVGGMETYVNALLCDVGDKLVLIDSGTQHRFLPNDTGLLPSNLKNAGINLEDIDEVIIEHGHIDHYGGLITKDTLEVLYPNARVWIPYVDYNTYKNESNKDLHFWEDFNLVFGTLEDAGIVIQRYVPGYLFEGFEALDTSGHSPGHTIIKVSSNGNALYYTGDVLYNEVTISNPQWPVGFDMSPEKAVQSRLDFINMVIDENALVMVPHINFPGLGYIERGLGGSSIWVPIQYQF
eukprot:TRINITY_DN2764_c1_g2_i5.p1 TRINITY_DN2764_c1_g2~~TRINITY_DN2764_c1_g2_i5.p1  ORF type:complete len:302 (+),score=41.28 TRINITY_DN2764_c1_g2_i5:147-1052(+)